MSIYHRDDISDDRWHKTLEDRLTLSLGPEFWERFEAWMKAAGIDSIEIPPAKRNPKILEMIKRLGEAHARELTDLVLGSLK